MGEIFIQLLKYSILGIFYCVTKYDSLKNENIYLIHF